MNLYDALRVVFRSIAFRDEESQRLALLAVDADEKGYKGPDAVEQYGVELEKQAAAARRAAFPDAPETPEEKANRLEAENVRLQALVAAQTRATGQPPAPPATPL